MTKRPNSRVALACLALLVLAHTERAHARPNGGDEPLSGRRLGGSASSATARAGLGPRRREPAQKQRYVGSQAYAHALRAEVARARGLFSEAAEELQLALVYDPESAYLEASLAEVCLRLGWLPRAEKASDRAKDLDPTSAKVWHLRGRVLSARGDVAAAERALRRALDLDPAATDSTLELAKLLTAHRRLDDAALVLAGAAARAPTSTAELAALAELEVERKRFGAAAKALERALERRPADVSLTASLSAILEREGKWSEAESRWRRAAELAPDDPTALLGAARAALWIDEDERAEAWVRSAEWLVRGPEVDREIGMMYLAEGRLSRAATVLSEVVRALPSDPASRFALGVALAQLGRDEAALAELELIGPEHALYVEARTRVVHVLLASGRAERARLAAKSALDQKPGTPAFLALLALVLERSGQLEDARALLADARRKDPRDLELADAEAGILLRAGDRDRGIRTLRAAVEASEGPSEDGLYRLGALLHRAGETEAAIDLMQRIIRGTPDSSRALDFVGWSLAERGARLDEAQKLLRRALAIEPRSGAILDSLGWVLHRQGRLEEAERFLRRAAHLLPADPDVLEHLADVLLARGRALDARERFVASRDLFARAVTAREPDARPSLERVQKKLAELPGPARAEP